MKPIYYGDQIQLFLPVTQGNSTVYKSIAFATNHTLSFNADTQEISSKDHGVYGATVNTKINWEITADYLYSDDYATLANAMIQRTQLKVIIGEVDNWSENGINNSATYWSPDTDGSFLKQGDVTITSLTLNAANGEVANYSVTLTGSGALTDGATLLHAPNPNTNSGSDTTNTTYTNTDGDGDSGDDTTYTPANGEGE